MTNDVDNALEGQADGADTESDSEAAANGNASAADSSTQASSTQASEDQAPDDQAMEALASEPINAEEAIIGTWHCEETIVEPAYNIDELDESFVTFNQDNTCFSKFMVIYNSSDAYYPSEESNIDGTYTVEENVVTVTWDRAYSPVATYVLNEDGTLSFTYKFVSGDFRTSIYEKQ